MKFYILAQNLFIMKTQTMTKSKYYQLVDYVEK